MKTLGECFENGPEPLTESPHPKPLKLTANSILDAPSLDLSAFAVPDPDPSMKPKIVFSQTGNPGDVPVMVLLVPFCPNQANQQFPPVQGVISSKVSTFALADSIRE